jgi:tight adherence protein C
MNRLALHRRRAVAQGLAEAIELLVISAEAGPSLDDAINRIVGELRRSQPAMADELALTGADLKILPSRDEALRRTGFFEDNGPIHAMNWGAPASRR